MSLIADSIRVRRGDADVLSDVSVAIPPGTVNALVGPNGAGKSTLLHALSGDLSVQAGSVAVNGAPIRDLDLTRQAELRAVMTQASHIAFDFLVDEVLRLGWIHGAGGGSNEKAVAIRTIIDDCDIGHLLGRTYNTLSGGEQQRVQFARSLLQIWRGRDDGEPRYLLLDEPTSNLDLAHELMVLRLSRCIADGGTGVLIALHDLNLAARFADNVVLLDAGKVVSAGPAGCVFDSDRLTNVYGTPVYVEQHAALDRLVVYS